MNKRDRLLTSVRIALVVSLAWTVGAAQAGRFQVSPDGTEVTDSLTGLIWQRCAVGAVFDGVTCTGSVYGWVWTDALQQARDTATATGMPWRIPNAKELQSITNPAAWIPSLDPAAFPNESGRYNWTSMPSMNSPSEVVVVGLNYGDVMYFRRNNPAAIRLVRAP